MQQLYTKFFLVVVSLLCSHAYAMENPKSAVPSLRDMCIEYMSEHVDELNVIPRLSNMPVELASDIVSKMSASVIGEHKDILYSYIEKKELDHTILSTIACQLSWSKTCLNNQLNTGLSEIKDVTSALHNGTSKLATFIEFKNKLSNISSVQFVLPLKKELTVFLELAEKIYRNKRDNCSSDVNQLLLDELSIQMNICIKEINALREYASTISIPNLAHDIAKNGPLSFELAQNMVDDFFNADIPDNFDDLCNHYFPEDVATNENYKSLYLALAEVFLDLPIKVVDQFPAEEFEKQLPATVKITKYPWIEVAYSTNKKYNSIFPGYLAPSDTMVTTVINPTHNIFLAFLKINTTDVAGRIVLINVKNMLSFYIAGIPADDVQQIGLNEDCTQLGIMRKNDSIISFVVPSEFVSFTASLKQRAFLAYVQQKIFSVLPVPLPREEQDDFKLIALFFKQHIKNISFKALVEIIKFAEKNKDLIPTTLMETLFGNRMQGLQVVIGTTVTFVLAAKQLNLTFEELCDKVISGEITTEVLVGVAVEANLYMDHLTVEERQEMICSFLGQ